MRKQELHPRTAVLNKIQKNQSKRIRYEALQWLAHRFPAAFDNTLCIRPLKLGIMTDILEHTEEAAAAGISKSKLRQAVVLFTRRIDYLTCLKAREVRIDLAGNPCTIVSEEEAEKAIIKIKKRIEKSARNARKLLTSKTTLSTDLNSNKSNSYSSSFSRPDDHSERTSSNLTKVVVTHKPAARQFDPSAVARLKEKLGLSKTKNEEFIE